LNKKDLELAIIILDAHNHVFIIEVMLKIFAFCDGMRLSQIHDGVSYFPVGD